MVIRYVEQIQLSMAVNVTDTVRQFPRDINCHILQIRRWYLVEDSETNVLIYSMI